MNVIEFHVCENFLFYDVWNRYNGNSHKIDKFSVGNC